MQNWLQAQNNNKILYMSYSLACLMASVLWSYGACELCNKILLSLFNSTAVDSKKNKIIIISWVKSTLVYSYGLRKSLILCLKIIYVFYYVIYG